jgi:SMI1 / KNR4 family (SUKH-1)
MQLTFRTESNSQKITLEELNTFETFIGMKLPEDYRQHMLTYNGGLVEEDNIEHKNYKEGGRGISSFYPIKYGYDVMEEVFEDLNGVIPEGYLGIGNSDNGGYILISLNKDTYGKTIIMYSDGDIENLSDSFTQLLNDMVKGKKTD